MIVVHPEICLLGDPVLRESAKRVKQVEPRIHRTIDQMLRIMREANGVGLAAPQIGLPLRLFVARDGDREHVFINPRIVDPRGRQLGEEGCLSLPGLYGDVPRASRVTVRAQNRLGREIAMTVSDFFARVVQHEVDHLNGVLFIDHVQTESLHLVLEEEGEQPDELLRRRVSVQPDQIDAFYRLLREDGLRQLPQAWEHFQGVAAG